MYLMYFRKILPSWNPSKTRIMQRRGSLTLVSTFMILVFSTLGLSLLYFSQVNLKLTGYKKNHIRLVYASENGIKLGAAQLLALLNRTTFPIPIRMAESEALLQDAREKGAGAIERMLGVDLPLAVEEDQHDLYWRSSTGCELTSLQEESRYFRTEYIIKIKAEGRIMGFQPTKASLLEGTCRLLTGFIPLAALPLVFDGETGDQLEVFLQQNNIELFPAPLTQFSPGQVITGAGLVPADPAPLKQKALKIKFFDPLGLSNAQLRSALGLEVSDDPVPEGVYLIEDDLGLGGVYVQGDVEEMVLAIDHSEQAVSFKTQAGSWLLRFDPNENKTRFITPTEDRSYNLIPLGIIMVQGNIFSLGGGIIDSAGKPVLVQEEKIPCVLKGVSLTIVSSEKIKLTSHLLHEGVAWQESIPYASDSSSQLNIFAAGENGEIEIDNEAVRDMKLQASITASQKISVLSDGPVPVELLGSLHTKDYTTAGSGLKLRHNDRWLSQTEMAPNAPAVKSPVLTCLFLKFTAWRENELNCP